MLYTSITPIAPALPSTIFSTSSSLSAKTTGTIDFLLGSFSTAFPSSTVPPIIFSITNFAPGELGSRKTMVMFFPPDQLLVLALKIFASSTRDICRTGLTGLTTTAKSVANAREAALANNKQTTNKRFLIGFLPENQFLEFA